MVRDHIADNYLLRAQNMSELQTDNESTPNELITQEDVQTDSGTVENGPELATGEGENPDTPNQEAVNKAINKQHAKYKAEEREKQAAQAELAEAKRKLAEFEASKPALSIPPIPDPYEDDYEEKTKARDAAIIAKANQDERQSVLDSQQQSIQQKAEQDKIESAQRAVTAYRDKAKSIGVDEARLVQAENVVANYGIDQDQLQFIIGKDDGALIIQHLAANPIELDDLKSMNPFHAAEYINSTLSQKAAALKPRTSNAPDPVKPLNGNGVDPDMNKHPALKGVVYS